MKGYAKLIFILWLLPAIALAQSSKKELELKKQKLQKEIDFTNNQLKIVSKNKNATKEQLQALQKKIKLREQLIGTINGEISSLGGQIENTNKEIVSLEEKMKRLKAAYADMVRYAYKNRNIYQRLMFVFAADDFNQAYKRISWLQQYSKHRIMQANEIAGTEQQLTGKKQELEQKKNQKTNLKISELNNKATLE